MTGLAQHAAGGVDVGDGESVPLISGRPRSDRSPVTGNMVPNFSTPSPPLGSTAVPSDVSVDSSDVVDACALGRGRAQSPRGAVVSLRLGLGGVAGLGVVVGVAAGRGDEAEGEERREAHASD